MEFLSNIMFDALRFFAYFGGYGWGIVWLTIAVNLALYPLTLSSIKSMGALQKIQPKIVELQKKYKDDPKELQKATLDIYKSEKINPLGGCLPVILKIPFFLALFWAFQSTAFLGIASDPSNNISFLWINGSIPAREFKSEDLVKKLENKEIIIQVKRKIVGSKGKNYVWNAAKKINKINIKDLLINADEGRIGDVEKVKKEIEVQIKEFSQDDAIKTIVAWKKTNSLAKPERVDTPFGSISILAILIGITTYLMQKTMPSTGQAQAQMMSWMMPIFIIVICWNFPAGVQIYWLVSNLVGSAQQYFILKKEDKTNKRRVGNK